MTVSESVAYSPSADAAVPVGTVIPGIIAHEQAKAGLLGAAALLPAKLERA